VLTLVLIALTHGQSNIEWWQTAQGTADRLTKQTTQLSPTHNPAPFSGPRIELDVTAKYQTILGFGGALTQASAHVFKQLDTSIQQQLMRLYYDAENGIGCFDRRSPSVSSRTLSCAASYAASCCRCIHSVLRVCHCFVEHVCRCSLSASQRLSLHAPWLAESSWCRYSRSRWKIREDNTVDLRVPIIVL
jgi:hypothetical protein